MDLDAFAAQAGLSSMTEIEKVRHLAFYHLRRHGMSEFTVAEAGGWLATRHLGAPNLSRLARNLRNSRAFVLGGSNGSHRLHAREIEALGRAYPELTVKSDVVVSSDTIVPISLVEGTRGFVEALTRQVNAAFEYRIYDGCAVLMRRLVEVLLILAYQAKGQESTITMPDGAFRSLNAIIDDAIGNAGIGLSRETKACLHTFRHLGNFSAHKLHYNAKRSDVEKHALQFRATVEELLYAAELKR